MRNSALSISRRGLGGLAAGAALAAGGLARPAVAQGAPLRVGLMLPFSGTFAALGENIAAAFELYLAEKGGRLGGRPVQIIRLDDESNPAPRCRTSTAWSAATGRRCWSAPCIPAW
jgi:branched-chain amino acid transport system substrate-binding protein